MCEFDLYPNTEDMHTTCRSLVLLRCRYAHTKLATTVCTIYIYINIIFR